MLAEIYSPQNTRTWKLWIVATALCLVTGTTQVFGQSRTETLRADMEPLSIEARKLLNEKAASIGDPSTAAKLLTQLLESRTEQCKQPETQRTPPDFCPEGDFYAIVHVLRWSDPEGKSEQTVDKQNRYVFRGKKKDTATITPNADWDDARFKLDKRILGSNKVWLVAIHLNIDKDAESYEAEYASVVTKKTPLPVQNLFALASLFPKLDKAGFRVVFRQVPKHRWAAWKLTIRDVPSDIAITPGIRQSESNEVVALSDPEVFDNEGFYHFDFGLAVPTQRISQLEFNLDDEQVSVKEVNKQPAFAVVNFYIDKRDLKTTNVWQKWPHVLVGVGLQKKPLDRWLFAGAWGLKFAEFYAGWTVSRLPETTTLMEGDMATPEQFQNDLKKRWDAQFSVGVNLPLRSVLDAFNGGEE